jgi:quercetin 2,3-dioxygenase
MALRKIQQIIPGLPASDGAGVMLIKEPIVQYGPFVMNTREEIEQAIRDYQSGALTR